MKSTPQKRAFAKHLRQNETVSEKRAWRILQGKQMMGLSFRRQVPMCGYIVDFYCPKEQIAIEIDGPHHLNQTDYDEHRDAVLYGNGVRVIRIPADMMYRTEYAREYIRTRLCELLQVTDVNVKAIIGGVADFIDGAVMALLFWVLVPVAIVVFLLLYGAISRL